MKEDSIGPIDQEHSEQRRIQWVVLEKNGVDQMMEFGGDLDTGRSGPRDDDGQKLAPADGIRLGDRPFDEPDDMVADPHRIGHRRQRQTVGLECRVAEEERDAAQRHDQVIVGNRGTPDQHNSSVEIEPLHFRLEKVKPCFPGQEPERIAHVSRTQRRRPGQFGLVLLHRQGRIQPGKASSHDHDLRGLPAYRRHPSSSEASQDLGVVHEHRAERRDGNDEDHAHQLRGETPEHDHVALT